MPVLHPHFLLAIKICPLPPSHVLFSILLSPIPGLLLPCSRPSSPLTCTGELPSNWSRGPAAPHQNLSAQLSGRSLENIAQSPSVFRLNLPILIARTTTSKLLVMSCQAPPTLSPCLPGTPSTMHPEGETTVCPPIYVLSFFLILIMTIANYSL